MCHFLFLPHFDVIYDLLLNRRMAVTVTLLKFNCITSLSSSQLEKQATVTLTVLSSLVKRDNTRKKEIKEIRVDKQN